MKKLMLLVIGVLFSVSLSSTNIYADDSSDKLRKAGDIIDILSDDDDHKKHKDGPGNSKNAKKNHGQNKKK